MITGVGEIVSEMRVLIYGMPALPSDVIARIVEAEKDMIVIRCGTETGSLSEVIEHARPHVVLLPAGGEQQDARLTTLAHHPEIGVLLIGADATGFVAHTVVVVPVESEWHACLLSMIRASAQPKRRPEGQG